MRLSVALENRLFRPVSTAGLELRVDSFRWHAVGGPMQAQISGTGEEAALWQALFWLRYGVTITDETRAPRWWGFVSRVEITVGAYTFGVSLDTLANRLAVAYEEQVPGSSDAGERATTDWREDARSVAEYGVKEGLLSMPSGSEDAALSLLASAMELGRRPQPIWSMAQGNDLSLSLECTGWWWSLDWRRAPMQPLGSELTSGGTAVVSTIVDVTQAPPVLGFAQSFVATGSGPYVLESVQLRLRRVGNPATAPLLISLLSDSAGSIGALLAQVELPAAALSETVAWVGVSFATRPVVQAGQRYWIIASRNTTVGIDAANTYAIEHAGSDLLLSGTFQRYQGQWTSLPGELYYIAGGLQETTSVLGLMLRTYGQFFTGVTLPPASGVYVSGFEDGDNSALTVVEDLLEKGSTRALRLLATVDPDRWVTVSDEPPRTSPAYYARRSGELLTRAGQRVGGAECPVGQWVQVLDIPRFVDSDEIGDPSLQFIEEAEYLVASDRWIPTPRGMPVVWDLGGV